ncbi:Mitochondrial presequence protease [Mycoemilia scoparia]|uniref:Presequence protease, mitochondrial n=1 Tax=Mycoemilia scoparia TaxID=417184 RepID=A0A9W8A0I4_9FUNG|nr:Mitochondrial presequence protease [Mycoemilia scoparia]
MLRQAKLGKLAHNLTARGLKLSAWPTLSKPSRHSIRNSPVYNRGYATVESGPISKHQKITEGAVIHGFEVVETRSISELNLKAIRLTHHLTGAEWLHLERDDNNNVFSVGFNTSPEDSTGVAHILEHTALCGSKKYPIRDPFFKMLNRSMSTFMNAWTAHDYTQYPFSTQNEVDYANLQSVYIDSAFNPLLRELDFLQEGWRVERSDPNDKTSPWEFKGIVFNEMKGALSDPGSLLAIRAEQKLFPDTTYSYVSGGDPQYITDLTHEALVKFHRDHYHPSNARFFSYGNFPIESQLERVNNLIQTYEPIRPKTVNQIVNPYGVKDVTEFGPPDGVGSTDKQAKFSVSYLANDIKDIYESFSLSIFSSLLINGTSAPMHKALIDSQIGSDYSANTGYNPYNRQSSLSVGLQGISEADIPNVKNRINEVIQEVGAKGFESRRIEAALQSIELSYKHKTASFGLNLMKSISTGWFHGCNPIDLLEINKNIARLKEDIASGNFFERAVEKYFNKSEHQLNYTMIPDSEYHKRLNEDEKRRLDEKVATFTPVDIEAIYKKTEDLAKEQMKKEDLSCLPTLTMEDVPKNSVRHSVDLSAVDCVPVQWRGTSTNGISYLHIINAFQSLPGDLSYYLPLFCDALGYLGTTKRDMSEIETDIQLYTGGIGFSPLVTTDHSSLKLSEQGISISSHCLDANMEKMYTLLLELILETNFRNTNRLKTLVVSNASNMFNAIPHSGHVFARCLASSTLTSEMNIAETHDGITQVRFINKLAESTSEEDLLKVSEKLEAIRDHVFDKLGMRAAIITNKGSFDGNQSEIERLVESYPALNPKQQQDSSSNGQESGAISTDGNENVQSNGDFTPNPSKIFCPLPFATNFAAKSIRTVPYTSPDSVKLQTLAKILTQNFLHREIREINGAYGGGALFSPSQGIFSFFSYRDPNPVNTIKTFDRSLDMILNHSIKDRELREAKLSIFGGLDAPISVSQEGMAYFTTGITDDMKQARRDGFFAVTEKDIKEVAEKYLLPAANDIKSSVAIIGEQELINNKELKSWNQVSL